MRTSIVAAAAFLDKLWGIPTLVDDPDATYLQKLAITGRYHGQIYALDSDHGDFEDDDGHKLKLMTGVEYSTMSDAANDGGDFSGWTGLAGLRLYF